MDGSPYCKPCRKRARQIISRSVGDLGSAGRPYDALRTRLDALLRRRRRRAIVLGTVAVAGLLTALFSGLTNFLFMMFVCTVLLDANSNQDALAIERCRSDLEILKPMQAWGDAVPETGQLSIGLDPEAGALSPPLSGDGGGLSLPPT